MSNVEEGEFEIHVLDFTFKVLTICGCWRPKSWTSIYKRVAYRLYTILLILLTNTFVLSQIMDIILIADNPDDLSDNFCILLPMFITCYKMLSLLVNRKSIAKLTNILMEEPCRPLRPNEVKIQQKFDKGIQINTLHYATLGLTACASAVFTSLLNFGERKLTYRAWMPFEYSSTTLFSLLYAHQLIGLTFGALMNVACDGLLCGFLVHICCQLEILTSRLKEIMFYSRTIRDCVRQHCVIFRFAVIVNATFNMIITIQFVMSMLVVCFNLYQVTEMTINAKYIRIAMLMCCMLTQIFVYCWYGNEVKLKVQDIFYY
ncbi:odorant receptor 94b-like [Linepithema humile]|uniref:odorant receptor 94b-like n=1 Tax=Linepithema humile TaxID=83485 RepID=UPI00351F5077